MTISHHSLTGLTSDEAKARLAQYGYNEVSEAKPSALLTLLRKFWAPVPWMLEVTIALTWLTARYLDAAIIGFCWSSISSSAFSRKGGPSRRWRGSASGWRLMPACWAVAAGRGARTGAR